MWWAPITTESEQTTADFLGLADEPGGLRSSVEGIYESPLVRFFFYCPRSMWRLIATEFNQYERQQRHSRALALLASQRQLQRPCGETIDEVKSRM